MPESTAKDWLHAGGISGDRVPSNPRARNQRGTEDKRDTTHHRTPKTRINSPYKMFLLKGDITSNFLAQHPTELPPVILGRGVPQTAQHGHWISPGRDS